MKKRWSVKGVVKDTRSITADWDFTHQELIDGVVVREVRNVPKENGYLTEVYRAEWKLDGFGVDQVFQVVLRAGGISAWHSHAVTTDRLFINSGTIRIALYDARKESPTHGLVNDFRFGEHRPAMVVVPPGVLHGLVNLSNGSSSVLNLVDKAYEYGDPDHWRVPYDSDEVPYDIVEGKRL